MPMPEKLTEAQRKEMVSRYENGESSGALGLAFGVSKNTVQWHVKSAGLLRSRAEDAERRHKPEISTISAVALSQLYWGPDLPSVNALAARFEVGYRRMKSELLKRGIELRPLGRQLSIEVEKGRRKRPVARKPGCPPHRTGWTHTDAAKRAIGKASKARGAERSRRRRVPCSWCGKMVDRLPGDIGKTGRVFCCSLHSTLFRHWLRREGAECPRPLILDRLRDLLREHPYKALPFTYETVEKAAATIGAGDAEIIEVLMPG